jgi:transposase
MPTIAESVEELKQRLQREHDGRRKPRLQMLYLLASDQAHTRQEVARLLGLSRNTVARWLTTYQTGGLPTLLDIYIPAGKRRSLAPDVLASIEQALHRPEGFGSYGELRQWVEQTHGVQVKYKTLYTIVRMRFKTKLKVPRPSHIKNL